MLKVLVWDRIVKNPWNVEFWYSIICNNFFVGWLGIFLKFFFREIQFSNCIKMMNCKKYLMKTIYLYSGHVTDECPNRPKCDYCEERGNSAMHYWVYQLQSNFIYCLTSFLKIPIFYYTLHILPCVICWKFKFEISSWEW